MYRNSAPPTPTPNNNNNKIKLKNIIISPQNSNVTSYLSYLDYPWIAVLFSTMYCICCDEDPQKFFRGQLLDTPVWKKNTENAWTSFKLVPPYLLGSWIIISGPVLNDNPVWMPVTHLIFPCGTPDNMSSGSRPTQMSYLSSMDYKGK